MTEPLEPLDPDLCAVCRQAECDHTAEESAEARRRHVQGLPALVLSGDGPQQQRIASRAKRGETKADVDFALLMADERFRRFMWRMMNICGMHRCDPLTAPDGLRAMLDEMFAKGQRNIANFYYHEMERLAVADVAKMIAENGGSKNA